MTAFFDINAALLTVGFGGFGFLAPRYTAAALDLAPTTFGQSCAVWRARGGAGDVVALGRSVIGCCLGQCPAVAQLSVMFIQTRPTLYIKAVWLENCF